MKQKKEKRYSLARETFQRLMKNRLAMFGLFVLCVLVLTAIPLWGLHNAEKKQNTLEEETVC